jgi:two-component system, LytTR family, sensor histidine kinase AgrC
MNFAISISFILFIDFVYIHLLLTRKRSLRYTLFILLINYLIALLANFLTYIFLKDTIYAKYVLYIIAFSFIAYISLCYEENISKKLFTQYTAYLLSNVILIICTQIITLFSSENLNFHMLHLQFLFS